MLRLHIVEPQFLKVFTRKHWSLTVEHKAPGTVAALKDAGLEGGWSEVCVWRACFLTLCCFPSSMLRFFSGVLVGKSERLPSQMKDDIIASELQAPV